MYDLTDVEVIKYLCRKYGFTFSKGMGQNFILDPNVPDAMSKSAAEKSRGVIEIGAGFGTLTAALAQRAEKVVAIELDERLGAVLSETLAGFDNIRIIWGDVLKTDIKKLISEEFGGLNVSVAANLPYYITTPIIMNLVESRANLSRITVMIQKEVATRLASDEKGKDYGAISVAIAYYSRPEILLEVPKECFFPMPKVDSSVIQLDILDEPSVKVSDEKKFFAVVKASFAQRRKTLKNALVNSGRFDKDSVTRAIEAIGESPTVRGEALSIKKFAELSENLILL